MSLRPGHTLAFQASQLSHYLHLTAEAADTAVAKTAEKIKDGFLCTLSGASGDQVYHRTVSCGQSPDCYA